MQLSRRHLVALPLVFCVAASGWVSADTPPVQPHAAGPDGRWKMTIEFWDEARPAGLEIIRKGDQVTGKFVAAFAGGEVPIEGEYAGGTLTFQASTTGGPHPGMSLDFTATLKDNATLAGTMSAPFGDFAWTAERIH